MKEGGINKIASVGFCWGGVMVAHTLDEYASDVVCGVVPHPSFGLEDMVYGGKSLSLIQAVKRPMLLCPAGNDPDNVKEGGELILALKANNPDSETSMDFQDQQHGFSLRGDVKDPNIKAKVELFLEKAYAFISKYL
jgi:dienelactone hydrolase